MIDVLDTQATIFIFTPWELRHFELSLEHSLQYFESSKSVNLGENETTQNVAYS